MGKKVYSEELDWALARPNAHQMCRDPDANAEIYENDCGEWPEEHADAFGEIISRCHDDPEKAFAYVILGASRSDHPAFLGGLGCGPLEDVLQNPSEELLERIVAEARKSARFRWLLSNPFRVAIGSRSWDAIEKFRITGPHEEPSHDKLPLRK